MSPEGSVNTTTVVLTALHTRNAVTEGSTLAEGPLSPPFPYSPSHNDTAVDEWPRRSRSHCLYRWRHQAGAIVDLGSPRMPSRALLKTRRIDNVLRRNETTRWPSHCHTIWFSTKICFTCQRRTSLPISHVHTHAYITHIYNAYIYIYHIKKI